MPQHKQFYTKGWHNFQKANPELRTFQALREYLQVDKILVEKDGEIVDTFYWTDK